jgi:hypothetical protein
VRVAAAHARGTPAASQRNRERTVNAFVRRVGPRNEAERGNARGNRDFVFAAVAAPRGSAPAAARCPSTALARRFGPQIELNASEPRRKPAGHRSRAHRVLAAPRALPTAKRRFRGQFLRGSR